MAHMLHGVEVKVGTQFPDNEGGGIWTCSKIDDTGVPFRFENPKELRYPSLWFLANGVIHSGADIGRPNLRLMPQTANTKQSTPSPATLEAESLAKRLDRLRELIRVEAEISAHKTAGKALTEKRAALVAELYPVAPKAKGKAKARK